MGADGYDPCSAASRTAHQSMRRILTQFAYQPKTRHATATDLTYFDMMVKPKGMPRPRRPHHRRSIAHQPLKDENVPADMKDYKRIILTIDKDTPFTRYAAAYLPPEMAKQVKEMQVVTLRGVFAKVAQVKGGRDKTANLPLIACFPPSRSPGPRRRRCTRG